MFYNVSYITFFLMFLYSGELTLLDIETISKNFIQQKNQKITSYSIDSIENINADNTSLYITHLNPKGFILLSSEDRTVPILGYSFSNTIIEILEK